MIVGLAQGIAQCPIVNLVSRWFQTEERAMGRFGYRLGVELRLGCGNPEQSSEGPN